MNQLKSPTCLKTEIILIDNFDSFTYNLVNQLSPEVDELKIFRNNVPFEKLCSTVFRPPNGVKQIIVISPGPGDPDSAGLTLELIKKFSGSIPILGICLGHQAIVQHYSGVVGRASKIVHGKSDDIYFENYGSNIFLGLESPFKAARYHSLAATAVPDELEVIATSGNEVMAIKHRLHKVLGFQFHPESILTPQGTLLINNSIQWLIS